MIEEVYGNILDLEEGILVHGCNCLGVMGAGIAAAIKEKWPAVYQLYRHEHAANGLHLGQVIPVGHHDSPFGDALHEVGGMATVGTVPQKLIVVNAMTQYDVKKHRTDVPVDYDAVLACFAQIRLMALRTGLSVNFPLIGCGLGGGQWGRVAPMIAEGLGPKVTARLWRLPVPEV